MSKIKRIALAITVMSLVCFSPYVSRAIGFFKQDITIPLVELKVPKTTESSDDRIANSSESIEIELSILEEGLEVEENKDH